MTKKELAQMEKVQREKELLRKHFLDAIKSYSDDLSALRRVNRINGVKDPEDLEETTLKRYEILAEYGFGVNRYEDRDSLEYVSHVIYSMIDSEKQWVKTTELEHPLGKTELWVNDVIWSDMEMCNYVRYMQIFGYDRMVFTYTGGSTLEMLTQLVSMGAEIVGTNRGKYSKAGLVISIKNVSLDVHCMWKVEEIKNDKNILSEDKRNKLISEYTKLFNLVK